MGMFVTATAELVPSRCCKEKLPWAARYNSWLLIELTPKGVILSCLFLQGKAADSAAKTTEGIS